MPKPYSLTGPGAGGLRGEMIAAATPKCTPQRAPALQLPLTPGQQVADPTNAYRRLSEPGSGQNKDDGLPIRTERAGE